MMLFGEADTRLRDGETAAAAPRPDATFEERWSAAVDAQLKAYNLNSEWSTKEAAFDASIDGLFALTGQRLENPYRDRGLALDMSPEAIERRTGTNPVTLFESEVQRLAGQMPDKAGEILKFGRVLDRARETRNTAVRRLEDVTARSPFAPNVPLFGPVDPVALAGSLWGSLGDPATLAVNALGAAGKGGTLLYHFARSALINAGAEVAQQPFIKQWANEAGDPYGWDDAARSVAAAALLGGALDTAVRGGYRGVQRARGLEPVREGALITGWRSPEEKAAALDAAAARLPEDNPVRRAAEGDVAAVREIAEATGTIEDPALRGAILAREMSDGLDAPPAMALDGGEGYAALAQALRSATDPDEPSFTLPRASSEQRRAAAAEALARSDHAATHGTLLEGRPAIDDASELLTPADVDAALDMWRYVSELRKVPQPERIVDWLRRTGGLREDAGELRAMLGAYNKRPGLVSRAGRHLDDATLSAWEEGFLVSPERPEINDLLEAISSDLAGEPVVRAADRELLDELAELKAYERDLDDLGILNVRSEDAARAALGRGSRSLAREGEAGGSAGAQGPRDAGGRQKAVTASLRGSDVAADSAAQILALERDLARSIEHAAKPALRAERAAKLSQIKREPATRAKSTSDSLRTTSIDVPQDLFRWLGVEPARFQADYDFIARKRAEKPSPGADLSDPAAVRTFVEDVLTRASIALRTSEKHAANTWDLIARNGADKVVGVRLELKAGRYNVRTALAYEAGQLERRLAASLKEHGDDAVRWRDPEAASEILALMRRDSALAKDLSAQKLMTALARSQDGLADLAIAEGRYVHAHAATERMAEIRAEIDRTVKMLPKDVRLRVVDTLRFGEREANGAWDGYDRIVYVSLAAADPVRAVRHETVHALRQSGLMTDAEFATLYRFAESAGLRQAYKIDANYGDLYRKAYADRGDAGVEALLREETIADLFADYSLNGRRFADEFGRAGRTVDKVLDAIVKFLKQVRDALHIQGFRDVRDIFEAIESGAMAGRAERVKLPGGGEIEGFHLFALKAFHGTPHTFDPEPGAPAGRFRSDKIDSGEGAQAFGHGLYFAESKATATFYQKKLSKDPLVEEILRRKKSPYPTSNADAAERKLFNARVKYGPHQHVHRATIEIMREIAAWREERTLLKRVFNRSKYAEIEKTIADLEEQQALIESGAVEVNIPAIGGKLYEVRIDAEPDQFLDWDKPLSQQPPAVRQAIESDPAFVAPLSGAPDNFMRNAVRDPSTAIALREAGVVGVRYFDRASRRSGDGTSNFVIFPGNEHLVEIVAVDGKPVVNLAADLAGVERTTDLQHLAEACKL